MSSIRGLVVMLGFLGSIPLVISVGWLLHSNYRHEVSRAESTASSASAGAALKLSEFIGEARATLEYFASRQHSRRLDPRACDPLFEDFHVRQSRYANLLTLDLDGNLVCSAAPGRPGAPIRVDPRYYLDEVKRTNDVVIGRLAQGFVTGRWVISMARPLHDDRGQMIGVLALPFDLTKIQPAALSDPSIVSHVVDADGYIIARSEASSEFVGRKSDLDLEKLLALESRGAVRMEIGDVENFVAAARVRSTNWIVVTTQPVAVALAFSYTNLRINIVILATVWIVMLALSWAIAHRIIQPIQELAKTVDRIKDDPGHRMAAADQIEVQRVVASFNAMLDRLSATEMSLRDSEARLSAIIDTAFDAIISIDDTQRIVLFSRGAELMFGCSAEEALGGSLDAFIPERFRSAHRDYVGSFSGKAENKPRTMGQFRRVYASRSSGEEFPVEATISQISVNRARIMTVVLRDLSLQKRMEDQLQQAQKMETVGQLTGGIAHDFNNLLSIILGNLELLEDDLREGSITPGTKRRIQAAIGASERGASLTRSLLAFSRQQTLDVKPVDPRGLVGEMHELLSRTLPENITLRISASGSWTCAADPGQLQNALLNLAINSRDAMPNGGMLFIKVTDREVIRPIEAAENQIPAGDYVVLSVIDTGLGMPPEISSRVFEPFFTTKGPGKGSGLGLSMVYGLIKQLHGHIRIESAPGRGTIVEISLPKAGTGSVMTDETGLRGGTYRLVNHEGILVVEDDDAVRNMAEEILTSLGYAPILAANGAEAMDALKRSPGIRLMLTDIVMAGGIGGWELADRARSLRSGLRIIFMTGYSEQRRDQLPEGTYLLQKPFTRKQLGALLNDALVSLEVETVAGARQGSTGK